MVARWNYLTWPKVGRGLFCRCRKASERGRNDGGARNFTLISRTLHIDFISARQTAPMKLKAIIWVCGATVTATGLLLGLRNAARAVSIDYDGSYQMRHPLYPGEQRVRHPHVSDDPFSPDAFRDELLK